MPRLGAAAELFGVDFEEHGGFDESKRAHTESPAICLRPIRFQLCVPLRPRVRRHRVIHGNPRRRLTAGPFPPIKRQGYARPLVFVGPVLPNQDAGRNFMKPLMLPLARETERLGRECGNIAK
jgi:hypothetical protein